MTAERDGEERQTTTMITSLISRNNFGETEMTLNRQKVTRELRLLVHHTGNGFLNLQKAFSPLTWGSDGAQQSFFGDLFESG